MHFLESVPDDEVPAAAARGPVKGIWIELIDRMLTERKLGKVVVVELPDNKELSRLRNGVQVGLRNAGYRLHPAIVQEAHGLRVYLQIQERDPQPNNGLPERDALGRRRRRSLKVS